jgi:hypothetical protein
VAKDSTWRMEKTATTGVVNKSKSPTTRMAEITRSRIPPLMATVMKALSVLGTAAPLFINKHLFRRVRKSGACICCQPSQIFALLQALSPLNWNNRLCLNIRHPFSLREMITSPLAGLQKYLVPEKKANNKGGQLSDPLDFKDSTETSLITLHPMRWFRFVRWYPLH